MGRFDQKYSDEMKDALVRAADDDGLGPTEALRRLNAGELGVEAPAEPMPFTSAQDILKDRRRKRRQQRAKAASETDPAQALRELFASTVAGLDARVKRLANTDPGKVDDEAWRKVAAAQKELAHVAVTLGRARSGPRPVPDSTGGESRELTALERLRAAHEQTKPAA